MRFCIVGNITSTLRDGWTGGAERQAGLLAASLRDAGHDVLLVVPGWTGGAQTPEGFRICSGWRPETGLRGVRWMTHWLPSLRAVLERAMADAYYCRGFSLFAPSVVSVARTVGAVSLLGIASDSDLDHSRGLGAIPARNAFARLSNGLLASRYYRRRGLVRASRVIVQTRWQAREAESAGLKWTFIRSIVPPTGPRKRETLSSADVAWIGSLSLWKGVAELDSLAERLPEVSFDVIGPLTDASLGLVLRRLTARPNVRWLGEVPHESVLDRVAAARLVINTSPEEGVSNAMLEAWALGTPVIALSVNPDGLLSDRNGLGACAEGDVATLAHLVREWLADSDKARAAGERARQYVLENHSPAAICKAFERVVLVEQAGCPRDWSERAGRSV